MPINDVDTCHTLPFAYERVFEGLLAVLGPAGFLVTHHDHGTGRVTASAGMSARSWGEHLVLQVERRDDTSADLRIRSPEDAAVTAADRSGRRVAQVPRLIAPPPTQGAPQAARWQLELDGPTTVRDARAEASHETRTLYVRAPLFRAGREVSIADVQQPTEFTGTYDAAVTIGERDKPPQWRNVRFTRRADTPVAFTAVVTPSPLAARTGAPK